MNHTPLTGPTIKFCTYPRGGKPCGVPFERPQNMADGTWKQCTRCPGCRKLANQTRANKVPEGRLGSYEVKNTIIDNFIYHHACPSSDP